MTKSPRLIAVTGPTAVGKTAFTVALAKKLNTVVVSCDSRQFYKEMSVGTAKPSEEELEGVKHFFINSHSIKEALTAGTYEKEAIALLDDLFNEYNEVILTGGSGLYLDAILHGIDEIPPIDDQVKHQLEIDLGVEGMETLQQELFRHDPTYYKQIDVFNSRRLLRAIGVIRTTGKPFSSFHRPNPKERNFKATLFVLNRDRNELHQRINQRVLDMMQNGLEEEARQLHEFSEASVLQTVGYQELFDYFEGKLTHDKAIALIQRNSRRFAKRQITWFKRYQSAHWLNLTEVGEEKALSRVLETIND